MDDCLLAFLASCKRFILPGPFAAIPADENAYAAPDDPLDVFSRLRGCYDDTLLAEAGLLVRSPDGKAELNPALARPGAPLNKLELNWLRKIAIGTEQRVVGIDVPAIEAFAGDAVNGALCTQSGGSFIAAANLADAMILRACGVSAMPLYTLASLCQAGVDSLTRFFELDPLRDENSCDNGSLSPQVDEEVGDDPLESEDESPGLLEQRYQLIVADSWLAEFTSELPPQAIDAVNDFRELVRFRKLDTSDIGSWRPTAEDLDGFRFALRRGEKHWITRAVYQSAVGSLRFFNPPMTPLRDVATDLATAIDRVTALAAKPGVSRKERELAFQDLEGQYRRTVDVPLMTKVQNMPDPGKRVLGTALSSLGRTICLASPTITADLATRYLDPDKVDDDRLARNILAVTGAAKQVVAVEKRLNNEGRDGRLGRSRRRTVDAVSFGPPGSLAGGAGAGGGVSPAEQSVVEGIQEVAARHA
jgi:hypothetical protein